MSRRVEVTECPSCGAPVTAREITAGDFPTCQYCNAALPTVEDAPTPAPFQSFQPAQSQSSGFQFQSFRVGTPPASVRRKRSIKTILGVSFSVLLGPVIAVIAIVAASHHSNSGNTGDSGAAGNTGVSTPIAAPGSPLKVGYAFRVPSQHASVNFALSGGNITIDAACPSTGDIVSFKVPLPRTHFTDPANNTGWYPTSSSSSPLVYQMVTKFPDTCGSGGMVVTSTSFHADITNSTAGGVSGKAFQIRWHWNGAGDSSNGGDGDYAGNTVSGKL